MNTNQEVNQHRFKLIPFAKILVSKTSAYLVKGLIPRTGLVVIWGPAKCGKSFFIFDLVMHIVLGLAYRGRRVVQGSVIYLALEGGEGFKARVEAFRIEHLVEEPDAVPFFLVTTPVSLTADREHLVQSIKAQVGLNVPAAVVIDTLNRSLVGSESSDLDMSAYIKAADVIRDALGCVVIIVHHSGVDATRPRGHTSLTGAADTQIAVKRDALDNIIATVEWMKDGPEGAQVVSRLKRIDVAVDADGDPISSCVVVPADGDEMRRTGKLPLKGAVKIGLRALEEAIAAEGENIASIGIPEGTRSVTVSQWRLRAYGLGISKSTHDRARQTAFKRCSEALISSGHVTKNEDRVRVTNPCPP